MVVAQLAELLLQIPEVRISNPVIGKIYTNIFAIYSWKDKNEEKWGREWPIKKQVFHNRHVCLFVHENWQNFEKVQNWV